MTEPSSHLLDELASAQAYIAASRDMVTTGFMPDMSALEKRIAHICEGIQAADLDEQRRCMPVLAGLLKDLDACERDLRAWNNAKTRSGTS